MKTPQKTYVGSAVFFERLADDGWPEDAGWWPVGECTSSQVKCSGERVPAVKRRFLSQFVKSLLRIGKRS